MLTDQSCEFGEGWVSQGIEGARAR